jgi:hypothetical protein
VLRFRGSGVQAIDMLEQPGIDVIPERVQDEVYAFASREFGCGDKIFIAGDEDDLVDLLF